MKKIKKTISTYAREMKKSKFKKAFAKSYREFLLSEFLIALMEKDDKSIRDLAKEIGLSPTVIQNIRSGKQDDIKLSNFINLSHAYGYHIILEKGNERIAVS